LVQVVGKLNGEIYAQWSESDATVEMKGIALQSTLLNENLNFGEKDPGEYTLTITATNSAGVTAEVISCTFKIVTELTEPEPEKPKFTVTLDGMNGQTIVVEEGQPVGKLPVPETTEEDLYFAGWYTEKQGGELVNSGFTPVSDVTLYPRWNSQDEAHQVNFDGKIVYVPFGMCVSELPIPQEEKIGWVFVGWFTAEGTEFTTETPVEAPLTLRPHFEPIPYKVTLDPAGGTVSSNELTVFYGQNYGSLPEPVRDGYTFIGWTCNGRTITGSLKVNVAEDHVLVAAWEKNALPDWWFVPAGGMVVIAAIAIGYFLKKRQEARRIWEKE
jgi:uncharacterized repeat protein (TIGR02543 family)